MNLKIKATWGLKIVGVKGWLYVLKRFLKWIKLSWQRVSHGYEIQQQLTKGHRSISISSSPSKSFDIKQSRHKLYRNSELNTESRSPRLELDLHLCFKHGRKSYSQRFWLLSENRWVPSTKITQYTVSRLTISYMPDFSGSDIDLYWSPKY